jgi:16S rRNA (cytosine967-C5)-methyltransferase
VRELDPQPGESVLDLCAAPGGKLTFIAQLMRNEGRLLACDTTDERLKLIEQNCARLGVTCIRTMFPSTLNSQPSTTFDRILIDAPCSNTGVMRRRVDLRWRIRPGEIVRLRATQRELLRQAASCLRPGGTLIYSTCSLEPEENSEAVAEFLGEHPSFKLERTRALLPFIEGVDGTFTARLVRNG